MLSEGTVLRVDGKFVTVGVKRHTACDTCRAQCGGHCDKADTLETTVENTMGAEVGDRVRLYTKTSTVLGYAMLVFILPLVFGILGYLIPYLLGAPTPVSAIVAAVTFLLTFVLIWVLYKDKKSYETIELYEITEKYNDGK